MTVVMGRAAREARGSGSPRGGSGRARKQPLLTTLTPYLFLLVPVTLLLVFVYLPSIDLVWYGFSDYAGLGTPKWVGLANYQEVYQRPELFRAFWVSLYYMVGSVVQMVLALYLATVLSFSVRFRNLWKGIIFFPFLLNTVAIAMIFQFAFQENGTVDAVLSLVGLGSVKQQWLGNTSIVNWSMVTVSIWRYLGLNFVIFLGAIQSIPGALYEAADLDGASRWQQFRYIIFPGIKPLVALSFILSIAGSLAAFDTPYIILKGANGTQTFVIEIVQLAFVESHKVGLASALAIILLVITLIVVVGLRRLLPDEKVNLT
ncbi:carbohydrate ABC transporter membrane protein 1 (CUT1 family) [Motilibacter rhizosphaerae]|uniref:Carbohydrate ABC transporter membrane protein 1 (CUT1 family) n=1 Tax=Motilibacter rhizosphaerae TaxID=598652 RepID=A0A4Q7NW09_9ACTN|nr:sugar ABC transporter permease [Motilibacter rhizosphaerae]RZS91466.1 carbohydrate ABC transporter membrane protein 1 (CUT1 family) [Motilibacter rhizosphaerae]